MYSTLVIHRLPPLLLSLPSLPPLHPIPTHEVRCATCLQQLLDIPTVLGLLLEALGKEIVELGAPAVSLLESRWRATRDHEESAIGVDLGEGRAPFGHFNGRDAQRPNVRLHARVR